MRMSATRSPRLRRIVPRGASSTLAAVRETPSGSLARGLSLLAIVAGSPRRGLGLSELAENAGFDKATTHRLARVLVRYGCLVQDEETRRYRLGVRVLDFGFAYLAGIDVRERRPAAHAAAGA